MQTIEMIAMEINEFTKIGKIWFFAIGDTKGEIGSMYCFYLALLLKHWATTTR